MRESAQAHSIGASELSPRKQPKMKLQSRVTAATILVALGAGLPSLVAAQAGTGITWPHQRGFWGHAGISLGGSELKADCPSGSNCDDTDQAWRIFGGGRFSNIFGGEVGYIDFGNFRRGGGETDAQGLDLTLMAGVPFANNWSVFGKLGTIYSRTEATGTAGPGFSTGKEHGWGPRVGIGLQAGITQNWAVRADLDRYRVKLPGSDKEDIDTLMIGAQYTFR